MTHQPLSGTFNKPAKTPQQLVAHLRGKGLTINSALEAESAIARIGYYRLLIYMRPLQDQQKQFLPSTTFRNILDLYEFDRELRLLCLSAIERIEVALRAAIVNKVAVQLGPHFYADRSNFENLDGYTSFVREVFKGTKYTAVNHYYKKYTAPPLPPIWTVLETVTYGTLSQMYGNLEKRHRKLIEPDVGYPEAYLVSWFRNINDLRNKCAHHNRLWNHRSNANLPMLRKPWKGALSGRNNTFFTQAVVVVALLKNIDPTSTWKADLMALLQRNPGVNPSHLGFPPNYQQLNIW